MPQIQISYVRDGYGQLKGKKENQSQQVYIRRKEIISQHFKAKRPHHLDHHTQTHI